MESIRLVVNCNFLHTVLIVFDVCFGRPNMLSRVISKGSFKSFVQRLFQELFSKIFSRVIFKSYFPRFPKELFRELFEQVHLNVLAQVLLQLVEITMSMLHGWRSRICCADWCCGSKNCVKGCEEFDMRSNKETRSQFSC